MGVIYFVIILQATAAGNGACFFKYVKKVQCQALYFVLKGFSMRITTYNYKGKFNGVLIDLCNSNSESITTEQRI